jgi:hypothetical protein
MTNDEAAFQPAADEVTVPFRPRDLYTGYRAFGSGDGAVLMAPSVARDLRSAAESAAAERRTAGGLLYGCGWTDELGTYLVIEHHLEAGHDENSDTGDGDGDFTLPEDSLRQLREDIARLDPAALEVGWWRSRATLGEFRPVDFVTQYGLVGPDGVGLLVYGSGVYWGTAYLGPDGHAPDSAGTLTAVPDPDPGPSPGAMPPGPAPGQDLAGVTAGAGVAREPILTATEPPRLRARRRPAAPVRGAARRRGAGLVDAGAPELAPDLPADAQFVVGALMVVVVAAAIIIGFIAHSLLVALIVGVVGLLVVTSFVWLSHRY